MTKKLTDKITLPNDIIKKMEDKLRLTKKLKVEIGFILCNDKGKLHDEFNCIGTTCNLRIPDEPCKDGKRIGGFHTHPGDNSEPSISDIATAYDYGVEYIGGTKNETINCYVRKDNIYDWDIHKKINKLSNLYEKDKKIKSDKEVINYLRIIKRLKSEYLNEIKIKE